jgi:hypothetical protein
MNLEDKIGLFEHAAVMDLFVSHQCSQKLTKPDNFSDEERGSNVFSGVYPTNRGTQKPAGSEYEETDEKYIPSKFIWIFDISWSRYVTTGGSLSDMRAANTRRFGAS